MAMAVAGDNPLIDDITPLWGLLSSISHCSHADAVAVVMACLHLEDMEAEALGALQEEALVALAALGAVALEARAVTWTASRCGAPTSATW